MTAITTVDSLSASRPARIVAGFVVLATAGLAATEDEGLVLCPFRRCTGGYCPGCGMTRSTGALLRGDVATSWHHHPFLLLATVQAVVAVAVWSLLPLALRDRLRRVTTPLLLANAGLVFAIWAVRLTTGQIPVPFG